MKRMSMVKRNSQDPISREATKVHRRVLGQETWKEQRIVESGLLKKEKGLKASCIHF